VNGKTGEPVPVWGTVLGVCFALGAGVAGVLFAMDREEGFSAGDAVGPGIVGGAIGLFVVGAVLWLYYGRRWRPDPRTQLVSIPVLAGLGAMVANGPAAFLVGVSTAGCAILLPLMIWGGIVSRRAGTSWPDGQEPDSHAGG
jgi:O-antigen/teichoic acid export membrane protein